MLRARALGATARSLCFVMCDRGLGPCMLGGTRLLMRLPLELLTERLEESHNKTPAHLTRRIRFLKCRLVAEPLTPSTCAGDRVTSPIAAPCTTADCYQSTADNRNEKELACGRTVSSLDICNVGVTAAVCNAITRRGSLGITHLAVLLALPVTACRSAHD